MITMNFESTFKDCKKLNKNDVKTDFIKSLF